MSPNTELYEKLLDRYGISAPLPEKKREETLARKRGLYRKVMKRSGAFTLLTAVISYLFFSLRRKGIGISYIQSAVIAAAAAVLLALSLAGGIYTFIKPAKSPGIEEREEKKTGRNDPEPDIYKKTVKETGRSIPRVRTGSRDGDKRGAEDTYTVTFHPLKAGKSLSKEAALITGKIISNLKKQNNSLVLIPAGSAGKESSGILLIGTLEALGKSYSIDIKLVDGKSSRILFMNSTNIPPEGNIDKSAEDMAKALSGEIIKLSRRERRD